MNYMLLSTIGLGIAFLLYRLMLRSEKSFVFNRFYLLITLVLCLTAPLLEINTNKELPFVAESAMNELFSATTTSDQHLKGNTVETISKPVELNSQLLLSIYLLMTSLLLIRFIRNLLQLKKLTKNKGPVVNQMQLILVKRPLTPFSFFHFLFVNQTQFNEEKLSDWVIQHELSHSQQLHSIDILFIELLCCFLWFNPFVWFYKKAISENHEYLADAKVVTGEANKKAYAQKIIETAQQLHPLNLSSGFSYLQIKNRLIMLNKSSSPVFVKALKFFTIFIVLGTVLTLNSFRFKDNTAPFVVIVDAGHGGMDKGAEFENLAEKEVNLIISEKLMELSDDREVEIILTRTSDELITLSDRVDFVNNQHADLLLSIHCNLSENSNSKGVEAYYYEDGEYKSIAHLYSKLLVAEQIKSISDKGIIKTASFTMLKSTNCPAILLELGFLNNKSDHERLKDPAHQDQIATSIYDALLKIKEHAH